MRACLTLYHPWTSYAIVPLFALANVGIAIDGDFLSRAYSSPITLGIVVGYILGKPVGVAGVSWLVTVLSRGKLRPPVGWAATIGGGAIAGIGFTVSLLIASLAFHGVELREAKLGVLSAALGASVLTWLVFRATAMLPRRARIRALLGGSEMLVDLGVPVDPDRDHLRGPAEAPVTVVEYGDFECPYCGRAESVMRELLGDFGDVRYVWRHLPLSDVHPNAELAAEASEAAAAQGEFWEMHDQLLDHQGELTPLDLRHYAERIGLDLERFDEDAPPPRARAAGRGGRRLGGHQRRHRDADLLHQREQARRGLRHRNALQRGARRRRPLGDKALDLADAALLLGEGQLGGRERLEALVRNRLAALCRDAVGPGLEPRLRPFDRLEPRFQVLAAAGVELVLVEALGVEVSGLDPVVALLGAAALQRGDLLLDQLALAGEQLLGAVGIHRDTVARPSGAAG